MIKTPYFCVYTVTSVNYTFTFPKLTSAFCDKALLLYLQVGSKNENRVYIIICSLHGPDNIV